jgi:hypothetical protein
MPVNGQANWTELIKAKLTKCITRGIIIDHGEDGQARASKHSSITIHRTHRSRTIAKMSRMAMIAILKRLISSEQNENEDDVRLGKSFREREIASVGIIRM